MGYNYGMSRDTWEPLATLVLEAAYEVNGDDTHSVTHAQREGEGGRNEGRKGDRQTNRHKHSYIPKGT